MSKKPIATPASATAAAGPSTPNSGAKRPRLKHPEKWGRPHPAHGPVRNLPRREDGSIDPYYYCSPEDLARWDLPHPSRRPNKPEAVPPAVEAARRTGLYDLHGRELPPTHPDHGPMNLIPRQEDGTISAFYYCSKDDLDLFDIADAPPRRTRHDGWTPDRMQEFIRVLRATASVSDAAAAVDMSRQSAYKLYAEPDARAFRDAWDEALRGAVGVLAATAYDRAVNGVEEIVYYKGARVGVRWRYDNRLLTFLLRVRDPLNYAPIDELEGWRRHRALEGPQPLDPALDRLSDAEEEWGRRLAHEAAPALPNPAASDAPALPGAPAPSLASPSPAPPPSLVSPLSTSDAESPGDSDPAFVSTKSPSAAPPDAET